MAGDDGQSAKHGDMNIRVHAANEFPIRIIQPIGLERRAEFEQRVRAADFLEREHVGFHGTNAFADFGAPLGGLDARTRFGRLVEMVFDVVSRDAESFSAGRNETNHCKCQSDESKRRSFGLERLIIAAQQHVKEHFR